MPREAIAIREVERAVSRPVAMDIMRELFPRWGINTEKARLVMFGTTESIPTTHSTLHKEAKPQRLFNDLNVQIEVEENYAEYGPAYQPYKEKEYPPIFMDKDLRIGVRPVYREVQAEMRVTIEAKSRVHAEQIGRKMQAEMRAYSQYDHHEVEYHYQIQPEVVSILHQLWNQRETHHPYGETFGDWFNTRIDPRITTNHNHGNKGHQLAIRESQVSITGWCDFSDPPKADRQETGMVHSYSFSYRYTYMRPEHLIMYYPIAIHNRMISDKLIDKTKLLDASDFYGQVGWSHKGLMGMKHQRGFEFLSQRAYHVTIPHYDDWDDFKLTASFECMIKALLITNTDDPGAVLGLREMGSWRLKESALNYMKKRKSGNFRPFDSIFKISLHEWEHERNWEGLSIDDDLKIRFEGTRDPRKNYHFVLSLVTDPTRLSEGAIRDLLEDGDLVRDYLEIINPGMKDNIADWDPSTNGKYPGWNTGGNQGNGSGGKPITLNPDGSFKPRDWEDLIRILFGGGKPKRARDRVFASIITYHKGDL